MNRLRHLAIAVAALAVAGPASADDAASVPTFSKEVVRIFQNNCQNCHRPGVQFTPMGLTTYEEARPWAKSIRMAVTERTMPPWHADPAYGHFSNDLSMSPEEIDTIVKWVDAGCPQGDPADMPTAKIWDDHGWQIGEPDVVVDMGQDFEVPADGVVPYKYFTVKTDFGEDKFISAMEARAGNLSVVHHAVIMVRNPRGGIELPDKGDMMGGSLLGALSPGNTPSVYPEGQGKLLKRGATIVFQMHYTTNGTAATDRSYLGLKFHKTPVKQQVITTGIANVKFEIPPFAENYEVKSTRTFDKDVTIHRFMPHMHYRGKDFKYTIVYPDGREQIALSVPRYDFDWQTYFELAEPLKLPAGSRIDCVAHYDNTEAMAEGRRYFDASKPVKFGEQSWQEMMIGWLDYTVDSENLLESAPAPAPEPDAAAIEAPAKEEKEVSLN